MESIYLAISWALVGLIWVIQLVKYPAFHFLDPKHFMDYHNHHTKSITIIVMPLMFGELGLTCWLYWNADYSVHYLVPLVLVGLIWLSTIALQIPQHNILQKGKNEKAIDKLVHTNWIRTVLWTLKGLFLLWLFEN